MKSHCIEIYYFHLRKYRYKENILLVQNYILCYLKIFLNVILLCCELSFFYEIILYIHIFLFFNSFFKFIKNFLFIICVYFRIFFKMKLNKIINNSILNVSLFIKGISIINHRES